MKRPALALDARSFDLACLSLVVVLALYLRQVPAWLTLALGTALGLRWWTRRRLRTAVPRWLKLSLLVALLATVMARYGNLFGLLPGATLATGLLVLKLLETETARDARIGVGFVCFALMSALLFNQGMVATLAVVGGLLLPLATLRSLEPGRRIPAVIWQELWPGAWLLLGALPLALAGFVLVPRLSSPLWGTTGADTARTGLSNEMTPGAFTQLLTDDSPALRVSFDGPPPPKDQRYFRAYVLDHYDGSRWVHVPVPDGTTPVPIDTGAVIRYHITLEPNGQRVLPALDMPLAAPANAVLTRERVVFAKRVPDGPFAYALESAPRYRLQADALEHPARWLQLPAGFNPRTLAQGEAWRRQYGSNAAGIVEAALHLFHDDGFRYTLTPAPLGRNAMDDFLFDTREGFCEHYASAFVVLMRAAGIPARVVTGYQGGYWNAMGDYLLVRNSDAHAWGEVWLAGRGWVRVDPTAAVRPQRISQGAAAAVAGQLPWYQSGWLQTLRNHWDIVNRWWNLGVNGFDAARQRGLLQPFGIRETQASTLALLLAIAGTLGMAAGLAWVWRRQTPRDHLRDAFARLERKLSRHGVTRHLGEGPRDFLLRAAQRLPAHRDALTDVMHRYLELRYAHDEPPPESLRALQRAIRDFPGGRVVK